MSDGKIDILEPGSPTKGLDTEQLTVGANTVQRERVQVAGASALEIAAVKNAAPTTEYGVVTRNIPSGTQAVSAASLPLPTGAATEATLDARTGALTETAPTTDTASSGLNGRLQRIAQRLTTLIALFPSALVGGRFDVNLGAAPATVTVTGTVTASGGATETTLDARTGALTEAAPATDTASSGINGRLQRIAQRLTSLIALFPTSLGQGVMSQSFKVVIAADQTAVPISAASLPLPTNASTDAQIIVSVGASNDAESSSGNGTAIAVLKRLRTLLAGGLPAALSTKSSALKVALMPVDIPAATTMQNAAGTGNPNGTSLDVQGSAVALLNIVSSTPMSGGTTVNFEASVDDTTWVAIMAHQVGVSGALAATATADGDFRLNVAGYKSVRARISAWSAGVTTIKGYTTTLAAHPTTVGIAGSTINAGDVAHDGADSGFPVKIGGVASLTTAPAAVSTALDRVNASFDGQGRQLVRDYGLVSDHDSVGHRPAANTQATITISAPGSGKRIVVKRYSATFVAGATAPTAVSVAVTIVTDTGGAATEKLGHNLALPATAGASAGIAEQCRIIGASNKDVRLRFEAAGGANTTEAVSCDYDVIAE